MSSTKRTETVPDGDPKNLPQSTIYLSTPEIERTSSLLPIIARIFWQNGPVKANGVNGAQVDDVLQLCLDRLRYLNAQFPSRENSLAITKIEEALHWLAARTADRERRGVEGTNQT